MLKKLGTALIVIAAIALAPAAITSVLPADWLISKVQWNNFGSYSPTLTIYPTFFGRVMAAPSGTASLVGLHFIDQQTATNYWNIAIRDAGNAQGETDSLSMHQQFNCHFYFASKNPLQDSWNIDTQRLPAVMGIQFLNTCNYPLLKQQKSQ